MQGFRSSPSRRRISSDGVAWIVGAPALIVPLVIMGFAGLSPETGSERPIVAAAAVLAYSLVALVATLSVWLRRRASEGVERRTWCLLAMGLASWTLGGVLYLVFLATGGDVYDPAGWSQIGYLAAYPLWYAAFWKLRNPLVSRGADRRSRAVLVEIAALIIFSLTLAGILWYPQAATSDNIAQLVPAVLDLLLFVLLYGAVRSVGISDQSALTRIGIGFGTLAVTDQLVTFLVTRGSGYGIIGLLGYVVAMALFITASSRPFRPTEATSTLSLTPGVLGVFALFTASVGAVLLPLHFAVPLVVLAGAVALATAAMLSERQLSARDNLTGFLDRPGFEQHVEGALQLATDDRPLFVVAVDITQFSGWNAKEGFTAGDALLSRTARAVEGATPDGVLWGRIGADRFAIVAPAKDTDDARNLADRLRRAASAASRPLPARAAFVMLPSEASNAAEALEAIDEALEAGRDADRAVVAYAKGELDGLTSSTRKASLASLRLTIEGAMQDPTAILSALQPIVRLDDLKIQGYEALARFAVTPRRGPDQWIREAGNLGLGRELEIECLRRAWARLDELPSDRYLAINVSPDVVLADDLVSYFDGFDLNRLVIEITEHDEVQNYPRLASQLASLRARGARVAIDDTGAGHASLSHVLELRPDFVKLDRNLIRNMHIDPGKQALVKTMLTLSQELGAQLVAEGIETAPELDVLRSMGVPLGQGYLLGRPEPSPARWVAPEARNLVAP